MKLLQRIFPEKKFGEVIGQTLVFSEGNFWEENYVEYFHRVVTLHLGYSNLKCPLTGKMTTSIPIKKIVTEGTYDTLVKTNSGDTKVVRRYGLPLEVGSQIRVN